MDLVEDGREFHSFIVEGKKELARDEVRQNSREKSNIEKCLKAYSGLQAMAWERGDEVKIIRQFEEQEEFSRPSSVFK